jgi:hypothetical protein
VFFRPFPHISHCFDFRPIRHRDRY